MKKRLKQNLNNNSGFIVADFLFAFVMVIGLGILIFGFTFSLAVIEVGQYIVWSTARNYAAGNDTAIEADKQARIKFENLSAKFPLLTGKGNSAPWFELLGDQELIIGDIATLDSTFEITGSDKTNSFRQPWTGARSKINLKLFASLKIPFLGKVATDPTAFSFPVRAFVIRSPSTEECRTFFYTNRFQSGIKLLENGKLGPSFATPAAGMTAGHGEDNGC